MEKSLILQWLRQHSFAISFICGFSVALYGISIKASENPLNNSQNTTPPTITVDVKNMEQSVNYQEVDKFITAQNPKQIKFAASHDGVVILSDKPIILPTPYKPNTLADLGFRLNRRAQIVKLPGFEIAVNNAKQLPIIPPMIALPKPQPAAVIASAPAKAMQPETLTQKITAIQPAVLSFVLWLITAISTLTILSLLLTARERKQTSSAYAGKMRTPTDMVGEGEMFDFSKTALSNNIYHINTTYLNMLWRLGHFSKDSKVDTYFYMAFFIPHHQQYASVLKRSATKKETTS